MRKSTKLFASLLVASLFTSSIMAAEPLTADQQKQVEKIVHDYLVQNPEVLLEASQELQRKQQMDMQQQAKAAIGENANELFNGKIAVAGNEKGNVTVVEFFDYQCIHCKKLASVLDDLIKNDKQVKIIYKEFPIFGKTSEMASQAALAAGLQGKYKEMHNALLKIEKKLDETLIMDTAKNVGLNIKRLKKDMESKTVTDILSENRKLAEKMHLMGTPALVIASTPKGQYNDKADATFIPGAASLDVLQELVKKVSAS